MKNLASILVLVALVALMAASGASAKKVAVARPAVHTLVKQQHNSAWRLARHSHRALLA